MVRSAYNHNQPGNAKKAGSFIADVIKGKGIGKEKKIHPVWLLQRRQEHHDQVDRQVRRTWEDTSIGTDGDNLWFHEGWNDISVVHM